MKKIEVKGFILATKRWDDTLDYTWCALEMPEHGYITICPRVLTFDLPEGFDPIAAQIAMLEQQREKIRAELGKRITEITEEISKLTALPFHPSDAPPIVDANVIDDDTPF